MSNDLKRRIIKAERNFCFLIIATIMLACNGQKKMTEKKDSKANEKLTLVDQNNYSGADSTETMVITNGKALKSFYSRINRTRKPGLPVPEIDFSKNVVVIHCSSDENFAGSSKLSVVKETETEMVLGIDKMSKNENTSSSTAAQPQVSPFFVYTMPLTDQRVSFKEEK